ncbi:MAG TPA: glycoside hydrolase, partial [Candidatus Dormibacteraeota bacterium]
MSSEDLAERAREVLRANDAGRWTKPSPAQYPHQWNWDSGFASLGWATFDPPRAALEIESMLGARWRDGMVPHVHYDPRHLADYFPGPDWWPGAQRRVAVAGELTSGISNPPILA